MAGRRKSIVKEENGEEVNAEENNERIEWKVGEI
jgi:hypothetical protein